MVSVLLGKKSPDLEVIWDDKGELLFIDQLHSLVWIKLPATSGYDYAGLQITPDHQLRLGHISEDRIDGCLLVLPIEQEQLDDLRSNLRDFETWATLAKPSIPETLDLAMSVHDYLMCEEPKVEVLRTLAWYLTSHAALATDSGLSALQVLTLQDVADRISQRFDIPVPRNRALFDELLAAVEARRLVFLVGGYKSELSRFIEQFKIPANDVKTLRLWADFEPEIYREVSQFLANQKSAAITIEGDPLTLSLYVTLAYTSFRCLFNLPGVDQTALDLRLPHGNNIPDFANAYLHDLQRHQAKSRSVFRGAAAVEAFLIFLNDLLEIANLEPRLTVLLSFPSLAGWLATKGQVGNPLGEETSVDPSKVVRDLWRHLRDFTERNYNSETGTLKKESSIAAVARVGIVVESRRLSVSDLGEAFCKRSVLMLPPFSDEETATLWRLRYGTEPRATVLKYLREGVGGWPWFLKFWLDCFDLESNADTSQIIERLSRSMAICAEIVSGKPFDAEKSSRYSSPILQWMWYKEIIEERLSRAALANRRTSEIFSREAGTQFLLADIDQASEWLESGLLWLKHPNRRFSSSLRVLEYLPSVSCHAPGKLQRRVYEALTGFTMELVAP